jgi:hypothetical protein
MDIVLHLDKDESKVINRKGANAFLLLPMPSSSSALFWFSQLVNIPSALLFPVSLILA